MNFKSAKLLAWMVGLILLLVCSPALAALRSHGPVSQNSGFFPEWYMDNNGEVMELCIPSPGTELDQGYCLILPADVPNADAPISFPDNWPGEAFWWAADASMPTPAGEAQLILALEAAFGTDTVVNGDQVSFGRLRIRIDTTVPGTYTVTHPFGTRTFNVTAEDIGDDGRRAINFTEDIGIGAPGDFTGALNSVIGPFLRASAAPGGEPLPYHANPLLPGKLYLAEPTELTPITGGVNNVFRVEGPAGFQTIETSLFTLIGRVFNGTPTTVERATYSRTGTATVVEAFAESAVGASLTVGPVGSPQRSMQGFDGKYFGNFSTDSLPVVVEVIAAQPGKAVTRVEKGVTDLVTVSLAQFDPGAGVLALAAASSDGNVATLTVEGIGTVANGGTASFTLPVPPAFVTVASTQGGSDREPVVIVEGEPRNQVPVAVIDQYSLQAGAVLMVPAPGVLANDSDPDGNLPLTAVLATGVSNGTLTLNADGSFTYTPNTGFSGSDTFTYSAHDALGALSPAATVTITVVGVNLPPVAVNDSFSVNAGATLTVPAPGILGNDSDPDGNLPLTAVLATSVSNGTLNLNANGSFTYTANPGFSGADSFTYRARDGLGALSGIATVSITVNPTVAESLTATRAEFRVTGSEWRVEGTSSPVGAGNGNTITIYLGPTVGGTVIGTTTVQADGSWRFQQPGISPGTVRSISIQSSSGATVQNITLRVRL